MAARADHDGTMPDILLKFTFVFTAVPSGRNIPISVIATDLESASKRAQYIADSVLDLRNWDASEQPVSVEEVIS